MSTEHPAPYVAHRFGDYRIVVLWREDVPPIRTAYAPPVFVRRAILESKAGLDAMGGETWWEITDIFVDVEGQSGEVAADLAEAAAMIIALTQALAKLPPESKEAK